MLCHFVIVSDTTIATYVQSVALSLFNMSFSLEQLVGLVAAEFL